MNHSIFSIIKSAKAELINYDSHEAEQLLHILFQEKLDISRTTILAFPDTKISNSDYKKIIEGIERLKNNEPIQYILGKTEFYGLEMFVNKHVLIPRPETEELVEWILYDIKDEENRILDIGSGSGCIAVSLAKGIVDAKVYALDVSEKALEQVKKNAIHNKVEVNCINADILSCKLNEVPDQLNVIVSNPPYVTYKQKLVMHKNVTDFEPDLALYVSDNDPLVFYRKIAEIAKQILVVNGKLYFEINEEFGSETVEMLKSLSYREIELRKDLNGRDRMIKALI